LQFEFKYGLFIGKNMGKTSFGSSLYKESIKFSNYSKQNNFMVIERIFS